MNYFQNLSLIVLTVALAVVAFLVVVLVLGWLVVGRLDEKAGLRLKGPVQNVRIK